MAFPSGVFVPTCRVVCLADLMRISVTQPFNSTELCEVSLGDFPSTSWENEVVKPNDYGNPPEVVNIFYCWDNFHILKDIYSGESMEISW